jgi:O-antigen ligase
MKTDISSTYNDIIRYVIISIFVILGIILSTLVSAKYLVVIGVFTVVFAFLFRKPDLSILILLLFRTSIDHIARQFRLFSDSSLSVNFLGLLNVGTVVFTIVYFLIIRKKIPKYPFVIPFSLFIYAATVSTVMSPDFTFSLRGLMIVGSSFCIYILAMHFFRINVSIERFSSVIVYSTVIPILVGMYQLVTESGNTVISPGLNRIMGTLFHPSAFGMYLSIIWPLTLYKTWHAKKIRDRLIFLIILLFSSVAILMTYTRIAWVALGLGIIGAILIFRKFSLFFLAIPIALGGLSYFADQIIARFNEALTFTSGRIVFSDYGSVAWRFSQWKTALDLFYQHPIVGIGWWNFPVYNVWGSTPHNDYLRIAAESGILGLFFYTILIISLVIWFFRKYLLIPKRSNDAHMVGLVLITIIIYLMFSITDNPLGLPEVSWYFWAVVAIGVSSVRNYSNTLQNRA